MFTKIKKPLQFISTLGLILTAITIANTQSSANKTSNCVCGISEGEKGELRSCAILPGYYHTSFTCRAGCEYYFGTGKYTYRENFYPDSRAESCMHSKWCHGGEEGCQIFHPKTKKKRTSHHPKKS